MFEIQGILHWDICNFPQLDKHREPIIGRLKMA